MFNNRWNNVIVPAIKTIGINDVTLEPHRVDLRTVSDSILTEILDEIRKCRVFIGDITSIGSIKGRPIPNPNVMYEVGLAQAVRLPEKVILFRSDEGERPFDISNIRVHQYDPDNNPGQASVMSSIKRRIQTLEFNPGIIIRELPIDGGVFVVPASLPSRNLSLHLPNRIHPSVQALLNEDVEFNLRHVEPTAMFGGIHKLKAIPQRFGHRRSKGLIE